MELGVTSYLIYLNVKRICEVAKLVDGLRGGHVLKSECVYVSAYAGNLCLCFASMKTFK